ncbi:MAG TPA: SUKH-3 domain-containing protein, partial [Armatimonadota bacterium]|nr:SUKH-3 domain-containing protein [Armatimonadota bacterium]
MDSRVPEFSEVTRQALYQAGWYAGRSMVTTAWNEILERAGYEVHPVVEEFLREFGGLTIKYRHRPIGTLHRSLYIDVGDWVLANDPIDVTYYNERADGILVYIGEAEDEHVQLRMAADARV